MIILLFDAHKLDISDEFKRCILSLKGNDTKIRIVLNKADMVRAGDLLRVICLCGLGDLLLWFGFGMWGQEGYE